MHVQSSIHALHKNSSRSMGTSLAIAVVQRGRFTAVPAEASQIEQGHSSHTGQSFSAVPAEASQIEQGHSGARTYPARTRASQPHRLRVAVVRSGSFSAAHAEVRCSVDVPAVLAGSSQAEGRCSTGVVAFHRCVAALTEAATAEASQLPLLKPPLLKPPNCPY
jgi:hypothetical protein